MCSSIPQDDVVPAFRTSTCACLFLAFDLARLESAKLIMSLA